MPGYALSRNLGAKDRGEYRQAAGATEALASGRSAL